MPGEWGAFWVHSYRMTEIDNDPAKANRPDIYGAEYDIVEHAAQRQGSDDSANVSVLIGDGAGHFAAPSQVAVGQRPITLVTADFNGDTHPDVAVGEGDDFNPTGAT